MNRLKELRKNRDLYQSDVAKFLGISPAAYGFYETGARNMSAETAQKLAQFFNVSVDYLLGVDVKNKNMIPILGIVKAGYDYLAEENIVGYLEATPDMKDLENYFGLVVKGDSMTPLFLEGDYLVVHKQDGEYKSHDACIILINGNEATVKNIVKTDDGIELHPFNPCYPVKKYTFEEIKDLPIVILGKVVKLIRNLK